MSAILCLALYYEGIVGPTSVKCDRLSLLERADVAMICERTPGCRLTWLGETLWMHMFMGAKRVAGGRVI